MLSTSRFFIHKIFGYFNDEILGKNIQQLLRDKDLELLIIDEVANECMNKRKKQKISETEVREVGSSSRVHVVHKNGLLIKMAVLNLFETVAFTLSSC